MKKEERKKKKKEDSCVLARRGASKGVFISTPEILTD